MDASTPTRERILDAAMRLFAERGFKGTSVTQIETAAGLTPGAGGIYHHFKSKEALLTAGIERQLDGLGALQDIQGLLTGLGDQGAELTLLARYVLTGLDAEQRLLRVLIAELPNRPQLVEAAIERLLSSTYQVFTDWICSTTGLDRSQATVALTALFTWRLVQDLPGAPLVEDYASAWVTMVTVLAASPAEEGPSLGRSAG